MSYISELARVLRDHEYVMVPKHIAEPNIRKMADTIHSCSIRNASNRSYDEVYSDCTNTAGEYAIEQVLLKIGELAERNPNEFDKSKKDTYNYDVIHYRHPDVFKIEFKRMIGTWFTMTDRQVNTFKNNVNDLDALVTGYVDEFEDHYGITFSQVINPKTFELYWTPSNYKNDYKATNMYYSHYYASKRNDCHIVRILETRNKQYYDNLKKLK